MFNLGWGEILIILLLVLLVFGAKRIPELARSLGRGVNEFKNGLAGKTDSTGEPGDGKNPPDGKKD